MIERKHKHIRMNVRDQKDLLKQNTAENGIEGQVRRSEKRQGRESRNERRGR